jgi:hypothetical protein
MKYAERKSGAADGLHVQIVHEIPGRLRVRLSDPPVEPRRMGESVRDHEGIDALDYSVHTRCFLVRFDPRLVSSKEIVVRIGLALSLEHGGGAVRITSAGEPLELSLSALYSAALLAVAFAARAGATGTSRLAELVAGAGTAGAVLQHGYEEVRDRGDLDPEVLSVVYLLSAFYRGNLLPAAAFTWLATFGRHLIRRPSAGALLRPVKLSAEGAETPRYEVVVSPLRGETGWRKLLLVLPKVFRYAVSGESARRRSDLLGEIEKISLLHGEVLDGLGELRQGIPMKIR